MNSEMTYSGWVPERSTATGGSFNLVRLIGWMAATGAVLTALGTGGHLSLEHLQRSVIKIQQGIQIPEVTEVETIRTPSEDLMRIRAVIKPAISDLATTFRVSRQSVYNWLNGEPVAEGNAAKLRDLARAADVLANESIEVNSALLKRKFANGRTILQVAQAGESAREAALLLVRIHKVEVSQRERLNANRANRARAHSSADFDLPASNDLA